MKNQYKLLCFVCFISSFFSLSAQENADVSIQSQTDQKERSPIYDYTESQLSNTDTIPDFETKPNKLKITGTIFESDGITPAKDVLLYIFHADDNGDYQTKTENNKGIVHHQGWIKTNTDGQYTFYTFVPGSAIEPITYPRRRELKKIFPVIKEKDKSEYNLNAFFFDDDPLLTKSCRKRLKRKELDIVLKLEKEEGMYITTKNIILDQSVLANK